LSTSLSDDVRQFIGRYITSVRQLEILAFLRRQSSKGWSSEEIAARFHIDPSSVVGRVDGLVEEGLVAQLPTDPPQYRYRPASSDLDLKVDALIHLFQVRAVHVISAIYERSNEKNWPRRRR
jgi:DNA-binding IclR family transcriptional regulator